MVFDRPLGRFWFCCFVSFRFVDCQWLPAVLVMAGMPSVNDVSVLTPEDFVCPASLEKRTMY